MMIYNSVSWILCQVFILFQCFSLAPGEVQYALEFADSIMSCPDFENNKVKADTMTMGLTEGEDGEANNFGLNGVLEICVPIDSDYDIQIDVCKETEVTCEPMLTAETDLCGSIDEDDAPWHAVFEKMNVTQCPIAEGSYEIKDLILSLEPFKGCLSRDFCGYYAVQMKIVNKLETISCHIAYVEIVEKQG